MGKNKDKIRVSFTGYNAENVTGSQIFIECGKSKKKILVECGLIQDNISLLKSYQINSKKFSFKPKELDYVFLCHNHIDHIGLVPRLYKEGCHAQIIAPTGTKELYKEMCLDSARIMERDAFDLSKKFGRKYNAIYSPADIYTSLENWKSFERNEKFQLDEDIEIRFTSSGHIFKACQVELWIKNGNNIKKIGITSDLGNTKFNQYYSDTFQPIEKANLLIGETTYSSPQRSMNEKDREKDLEKIKAVVEQTCVYGRGKILIPVFALARSQAMLTYLYDIFANDETFNVPIYLDSPLAIKISKIFSNELDGEQGEKFEQVMNWKNIKQLKEFSDTEKHVNEKEPAIFLSCSGMMTAGRSIYVASKLLPSSFNHTLFCGYSAEGSLAWKIKQKKTKSVAINGKQVPCRCNVTSLVSFSSHMQYEELLNYYSTGNFDKIALVHGEFNSKCKFAKELQGQISKKNRTGKVICVNSSTEILL